MSFGMYLFIDLVVTAIATGISLSFVSDNLKENKMLKREINACSLTLKEVKKQLKLKKVTLSALKNNKSAKKIEKVKTVTTPKKVEYLPILKQLRNYLSLYSAIGANKKEFQEYYEQGTLDANLKHDFEDSQIETIKTYFKEHN